MREAHSPELRQPLIAAARSEPDGEARLEAVATLARDFANDPPGRAALEAVASEDSRPLIRAAARRGLAGDAAWREYVVSSLKDAGRSDEERVEALVHDMFERNLPNSVASYWIRTRELLDDEAIRSLAQLLPQLRPSMQLTSGMLGQLVTDVASIDHPAVTDMLLGGLAGNGSLIGAATAAHGLLDRGDDPRVRAALQGSKDPRVRAQLQLASVSDRDPRRREMAAEMLKAATAAATE
jgi:hypothetical protein